jgi:hypothetical protein
MKPNIMKKFLTILLLLAAFGLHAQPYNNEWIDFSKAYYKFKIAANGVYRIPQSVLSGAGLGSIPAQYFQLFRNGQEVPIYTSVASGAMGASDYIEFWGQMNDGKPDNVLYRNSAYQHTTHWSLETDTAVYFLTVNPTGTPFHYRNSTNDTTGNVLPAEPYFMYTAGSYFKVQINPGYAADVGEYVYSSSYDIGEFWSTGNIPGGTTYTDNVLTNLNVYSGGPQSASLKFGMAGDAANTRTVQISINGFSVVDTEMDNFNDLLSTETIPLSDISSGAVTLVYQNNCTNPNDWVVGSFYELNYPRQFNFGGANNFAFQLPGRSTGYYLNITGFTSASVPVLYDITTGSRYAAIVGSANFYYELPAYSSVRNFVMVSEDAANIGTVTSLTPKTFVNFASGSNQGNYLLISNPIVYTTSTGRNAVLDYKTYRSSIAGGSFNPTIVDVNELLDQFSFGIKFHPSSVKNFLSYARNTFSQKPQFAFLIGHGVCYNDCRTNESDPMLQRLEVVPTFGYPASDNKLSSADVIQIMPLTPIGRLSVINGDEIETYLTKVKEYEQTQQTAPNTILGRAWMKNVMHVTGASDPYLGAVLCSYMGAYQQIISDTLFGGTVTTFCNGNVQVSNFSNQQIVNLFATGLSILTYFGHSSQSTLQDNLDDPSNYNNQGKYPVMYVNGCNAGNFFLFDPGRISSNSKTLSETWVLAPEKGAVAFAASTSFGIVNYLNIYLSGLYTDISRTDYGQSIGKTEADAVQYLVNVAPTDYYARLHAEEMTLHGDPALKLNEESLPDYDIEASQVSISPAFVSVANSNFTVNATIYNLGKAVSDSVIITVTRTYPDNTKSVILTKKVSGIYYTDSLQLLVPIVASHDKGQNYITISVNIPNVIPEVTYQNNSITTPIFIYEDEATPIYPYNYAIISNSTQKLFASTANPFAPSSQYVMEIDTTEAFNSPLLVTKFVTQVGGVLEFDPGTSYRDSTVYYWRTSIAPAPGGQYHWNEFSFICINSSVAGFNQSHYYQHLQSRGDSIYLGTNRQWKFGTKINNLFVRNTIYPTGGTEDADFSVTVNGNLIIQSACVGHSLIFNVYSPVTFIPWLDVDANGNSLQLYGSAPVCNYERQYNFEFSYETPASRKQIMDFMDSIPSGYYVDIYSLDYDYNNSFSATWHGDTAIYGANNSLYNSLLSAGFTNIDSINQPRAWAFIYKKNDPSFTPVSAFTQGVYDRLTLTGNCPTPDLLGYVISPQFGPAKDWKQVHWRGSSLETPSTDSVSLQVIGIDTLGNSNSLYTLNLANQDYDISAINAKQYPYLQLKMTAQDSVHATPYQLQYWRLNYDPVPEGALAPNLYFTSKDTVTQGQQLQFAIAFKNVSITAFDSMQLSLTIIDQNNVSHAINMPKRKPLISGDTLIITYTIDTKSYPGLNTIFLYVNPHLQPEEYFFNNFAYKTFYVKSENSNPLLDVTFDGVHILNQDIVSAKPHILIKLKDAAQYLLLTDTTEVSVQLRYPDGSLHAYNYNTDTLRFTPAASSADNTATVDFTPSLTKQYNPQGDVYELIVTGRNAYGNTAGNIQFEVAFTVISKAMISNMLNYPNPFTTSTAFVFTITGSQVPQNIRVEIMTITGKVVREITESELGPLHVGRNITEYKWNGTDTYGQRLANGVYLYRVVTNLNGKSLEKYTATGDNTNQYFVNGYGKMYLMGK